VVRRWSLREVEDGEESEAVLEVPSVEAGRQRGSGATVNGDDDQ
jgi:hypothetical protein